MAFDTQSADDALAVVPSQIGESGTAIGEPRTVGEPRTARGSIGTKLDINKPVPKIASPVVDIAPNSAPFPNDPSARRQWWMNGLKQEFPGLPDHVYKGIVKGLAPETGGTFDPAAVNPNDMGSPSEGTPQWHADRMQHMEQAAAARGMDWRDPVFQLQYLAWELRGGDPIAAKHFQEITSAPDEDSVAIKFRTYFERGADTAGALGGEGVAGMTPYEGLLNRWNSETQSTISRLGKELDDIQAKATRAPAGSQERLRHLDELTKKSEELQFQYDQIRKNPPKPQTPFEAAESWAPLAVGMLMLGGLFTRRPALGAINALNGALDGLVKGNQEQYKNGVQLWDRQMSAALDAFKMKNDEIRSIMENERLSQEEKQQEITTQLRIFGAKSDLDLAKAGRWKELYDSIQRSRQFELNARVQQAHAKYWLAQEHKLQSEAAGGVTGNSAFDITLRSELANAGNPKLGTPEYDNAVKEAQKRTRSPGMSGYIRMSQQNQTIDQARAQLAAWGIEDDILTMTPDKAAELTESNPTARAMWEALHPDPMGTNKPNPELKKIWDDAHKQKYNTDQLVAAAQTGEEGEQPATSTAGGGKPADQDVAAAKKAIQDGVDIGELRQSWIEAGYTELQFNQYVLGQASATPTTGGIGKPRPAATMPSDFTAATSLPF